MFLIRKIEQNTGTTNRQEEREDFWHVLDVICLDVFVKIIYKKHRYVIVETLFSILKSLITTFDRFNYKSSRLVNFIIKSWMEKNSSWCRKYLRQIRDEHKHRTIFFCSVLCSSHTHRASFCKKMMEINYTSLFFEYRISLLIFEKRIIKDKWI